MASIFELAPVEEGGAISRAGHTYQDHAAAFFCLEMAKHISLSEIWFETHDDILLKWVINDIIIPEFVQVKSDDLDQLWSVAKLCERARNPATGEKGLSMLQKQLARDRGDELPRFRIVTKRDVNEAIKILTSQRDCRDLQKLNELLGLFSEEISAITSPKARNLRYWLSNVEWTVMESLSAIENSNILTLEKIITDRHGIVFLQVTRRKLYLDLISKIRNASDARWQNEKNNKAITRDDFFKWLDESVNEQPNVGASKNRLELLYLEKESIARCIARWQALGFTESEAESYQADEEMGALSDGVTSLRQSKFRIVVGEFGVGKSLQMERLFQKELEEYQDNESEPIPVFLEGRQLVGVKLRSLVEREALKIGNPSGSGLNVILDGVDEAGESNGLDIITQAYALTKTLPKCKIIITTTTAPTSGYDEYKYNLPKLQQDDALNILSKIASCQIAGLSGVDEAFWEDLTKPLFAILLGLHLKRNGWNYISKAELIKSVVHNALLTVRAQAAGAMESLIRLARHLVDSGGQPVAPAEIGLNLVTLKPLLDTRLVTEIDGKIGFSVSLFTHWFAAESLRNGNVTEDHLTADPLRLGRWHYALALYLSTQSFEVTLSHFAGIVKMRPAFAFKIIRDALRTGNPQKNLGALSAATLGKRLDLAFSAWIDAFGPLASYVLPLDVRGKLQKLMVSLSGKQLWLAFYNDASAENIIVCKKAEEIFALGATHGAGISMVLPTDESCWVWKYSQEFIKHKLERIIQNRLIPITNIESIRAVEAIWLEACRIMSLSPIHAETILVKELDRRINENIGFPRPNSLLHASIDRLKSNNTEILRAPYPQADMPLNWTPLITDHFSEERMLQRTVLVFKNALDAYEEIVDEWFPRFAERLDLRAAMPVLLKGGLSHQREKSGSWPLIYFTHMLEMGKTNEVYFECRPKQDFSDWQETRPWEELRSIRPATADWVLSRGSGSGLTEVLNSAPATEIAYSWIKEDLQAIGVFNH